MPRSSLMALWLAAGSAKHVVIIGLDGTSPDGIRNSRTPNLDALRRRGARTFHARGVMPTSSSPNWASMIMGAGPEQHGVTSNDWQPDKFDFPPSVRGPDGRFPTLFGVLRAQRPRSVIACFHDWQGFGRLIEPGVATVLEHRKGPADTTRRAVAYLRERKPDLTFIHLDHVDHAGHEQGHGTPQYYDAVAEADRLIGEVVGALEAAGMASSTIVIVSADHGGIGKKHGGNSLAELEIPWIIAGPGVAAGREIKAPVNTFDTAATAAYVLGLTPPEGWIGRPVLAAFQ